VVVLSNQAVYDGIDVYRKYELYDTAPINDNN
jgi:hypothetical protein